jgi:shikimate kinase
VNLFLIGYRGSGKTTVAAVLAEQLGWPWIDADAELESRAGMTIKRIFAEQGEPEFRDLESVVLQDLAARDKHVVALGGGVVLRPENRRLLKDRGKTVWLQASPAALLRRIGDDPTTTDRRPNLTGQGGLAEIRTLLHERTPLYTECADLTIDAENKSLAEIARQIIVELGLEESGLKK